MLNYRIKIERLRIKVGLINSKNRSRRDGVGVRRSKKR